MRLLLLLIACFASFSLHAQEDDAEGGIYLSLNISEGSYLQFSDGKTYEIAPDDRVYSAFWITPFPAEIGASGDPDYPVNITNLYTGTVVKGKEVSTRDLILKEQEKTKSLPPPKETKPKEERPTQKQTKPPQPEKKPQTEKPKTKEAMPQ